ncbi:unnamed protein product [marine sediment metagenome]|uniref:Type 4 fimbrial biogenesis protein PilO n=1 Tax=marine sediment metagenome TaxID=412755 RepID=X0SYE0_9ZZZZ
MSTYKKYFAAMALIWAGCAVVIILAYLLLFAPQSRRRLQTENQLKETKRAYRAGLKAGQKDAQDLAREQIQQMQHGLANFVTDAESSANLIFDLSQIANARQLDSFTIKAKDDREKSEMSDYKNIGENHIDVSFTGDFNQFATFLNAMERHQPVIFVDQFKITRPKRQGTANNVNMSLAVFVRKNNES